ncbi:hypothetical protein JMJ35_002720 [Cladonia borealis]|uniref:SnoaL-like domain-containing protein n=1 Tax=Cladonia borealis TaxID=184061 RepID=A0AA39R749_9LECA|nr:hypothetical protein JMJ35_002720 [Cladonia borealis]
MKFSWDQNVMVRPKLVVTAEDLTSVEATSQKWREEGFEVSYLPFDRSREEYAHAIEHLCDPLPLGENYAIVAFGEAATAVLDIAQKPVWKLCALIAYYPTEVPAPPTGFPNHHNVLVHLASSQHLVPKCRHYIYPEVQPGFAEENLDKFDKVSTNLAWSRTLAALRKGFEMEVDLERIWENHTELEFVTKDADATMATMIAEPYVNHIPTMTGGIGYKDLHRFYRDYFIPGNPPSMKMKLISRTVGTDRVVDELLVSFKHTQAIPWMLPGIEPTNKSVEVALVAIVCIRGGKLYHEHIYWDQASVLVQTGLLDPKVVPGQNGKGRLPVVDGAGARKVLDESSVRSNELLSEW